MCRNHRILQLLKDWVVAYGTDLAEDADFVNAINKFTKPVSSLALSSASEEKLATNPIHRAFAGRRFQMLADSRRRWPVCPNPIPAVLPGTYHAHCQLSPCVTLQCANKLILLVATVHQEQKRKAPARLIRNLSSLNGVLLQGQGPLSLNLHGVKQSCASSLPPSPHGAQSQEDLARVKSSDTLNIWASSPTILSGLPRTYSGSGASYTTTPRTSQPSSPYHSSSSVATRAPQCTPPHTHDTHHRTRYAHTRGSTASNAHACTADNEDDESTQYDTQGEEEDSADDSDAAVGEERSSRDLARHVRIGDDEFLDLDAEETAKQLTLIDNQLFRYVDHTCRLVSAHSYLLLLVQRDPEEGAS
jgi:hypothetical protein